MPYKTTWVPAELFLEHNGVRILHSYVDNDIDQGALMFWYQVDGTDEEDDFDIRELRVYNPQMDHKAILRAAIDIGEITSYEP